MTKKLLSLNTILKIWVDTQRMCLFWSLGSVCKYAQHLKQNPHHGNVENNNRKYKRIVVSHIDNFFITSSVNWKLWALIWYLKVSARIWQLDIKDLMTVLFSKLPKILFLRILQNRYILSYWKILKILRCGPTMQLFRIWVRFSLNYIELKSGVDTELHLE